MASLVAIHSVTSGLAQYLTHAYQVRGIGGVSTTFATNGTNDLKKLDGKDTSVSIFLYRIGHNEHLRNRPPLPVATGSGRMVPLTVDLHLLVTVWSDTPLKEQQLLAWTMRELHQRPVLDRSVLGGAGSFTDADRIQLTPEELTLDDMSKLWTMLTPPYRPSLTYVARNVPIDLDAFDEYPPVVATRFGFTGAAEEAA